MFTRKEPLATRVFNAHLEHLISMDCGPIHVRVNGRHLAPEHFLQQYVAPDGFITLSIGGNATRGLDVSNDLLAFNARFSGQPCQIELPLSIIDQLIGWYEGVPLIMVLPRMVADSGSRIDDTATSTKPQSKGRPKLTVIK